MFNKTDIEYYFNCFKIENILLIAVGIISIVIAMFFLFKNTLAWHKGFAIPLIVFGTMHGIAGYNNYKKVNTLKIRNTYGYDMNPAGLKTQEFARVQDIYKKTAIFIYINTALLLGALVLLAYFKNKADGKYYSGVAVSLFIMTFITLGSSLFMQNKTRQYINGIKTFVIKS